MFRNRDKNKPKGDEPKWLLNFRGIIQIRSLGLLIPVLAAGTFAMFLTTNPFASMDLWSSNEPIFQEPELQPAQTDIPLNTKSVLSESSLAEQSELSIAEELSANDSAEAAPPVYDPTKPCDEGKKRQAENNKGSNTAAEDKLHSENLEKINNGSVNVDTSSRTNENNRHEQRIIEINKSFSTALLYANCKG